MDRRLTPATERVAHISLQGRIDATAFTAGQSLRVAMPLVDLLRNPGGARERQLLLGEGFTVIDRHAGIDCSGLAQVAHLACGIACPGDSDLQEMMGQALPEDAPLQRSDLIFWKGHIALIVDETRLIHANGHTMSVAFEDTAACIARVQAQNGGPVTHRRRL